MRHDATFLGNQGFDGGDGNYQGSRYADVKAAMQRNTYYLTWGAQGESPLPTYEVSLGRILRGILPGCLPWQFKAAASRAVKSRADLRWGPDNRGYRRLLHPNGICLFGRWIIDQPTGYSGYFQQGSEALIVGRYSTCCTETRRGHTRSLSLVGKLYPTKDENHADPLRTANFITQEDLGGERTIYCNHAKLRNAPDVTPWRRGWGAPILIISGLLFKFVNVEAAVRQLHTIAELGKPDHLPTLTPRFMQLTIPRDQPQIEGSEIDFRDEILAQLYDRGNGEVTGRKLVFDIEVTDEGSRRGLLRQRWKFGEWHKIGRIEFTEAAASYNSDFVIHFPHPDWRDDPNDPATTRRIR
jgi:hypothetical protein